VTRIALASWGAVAPGLSDEVTWRSWAAAPAPLRGDVRPDVSFLPAMQRRRCDTLSRTMLAAVNACCDEPQRASALSVFASRHGSFATTVEMLESLARRQPLSPTNFSHSVHNTQAGLFSIWSGNQQVAQSLAARNETFQQGFLEAVCLLDRAGERPVLFVTGDEALPEPVAGLSDDPHPPYAVALLLWPEGGPGGALELTLEAEPAAGDAPAWPPAVEFLRWWLRGEKELRLPAAPGAFVWRANARVTPG